MDAQAEFNKLIVDLQAQIKDLSQQKTVLEQECKTLDARKVFLANSADELKNLADERRTKNDALLHDMAEKTESVRIELTTIQKEIEDSTAKRIMLRSMVETMQKSNDEEAARLNSILVTKRQILLDIKEEITEHQSVLDSLKADIHTHRDKLQSIQDEIDAARKMANDTIEGLEHSVTEMRVRYQEVQKELDDKHDTLEMINSNLDKSTTMLVKNEHKNKEFIEYEKRSLKALKAQEASILEREQELNARISRAKRQGGILEGL